MRRKIAIMAILSVVFADIFLYLRFNSMSNMNILPRKCMDEYLNQVYEEQFTFCSQSYHYATNYHIWVLTYKDIDGNEFKEYYYIYGPQNHKFFLEVKDYGAIWDTYAKNKIEAELADMHETVWYNETTVLPEEEWPRYHFGFEIDDEKKMEKSAKCLSIIYQKLDKIADKPKGCTLICAIYKEDELLSLIDLDNISAEVGTKLDENSFYNYLKSLE